jgi:hypothetical protein
MLLPALLHYRPFLFDAALLRRLLFGPERISRGVIGPRQRSRNDGRSDRVDGESPAGEREESDHSFGGDAADARANQVTEVPGNASFPGPTVTGDQSVAGFIPVPFDPNRDRPTSFTKSGKPLRKIRQDGLPVLAVKFPGPWSLLASRPAGEKWWSFARRARTYFDNKHAPDGASDS